MERGMPIEACASDVKGGSCASQTTVTMRRARCSRWPRPPASSASPPHLRGLLEDLFIAIMERLGHDVKSSEDLLAGGGTERGGGRKHGGRGGERGGSLRRSLARHRCIEIEAATLRTTWDRPASRNPPSGRCSPKPTCRTGTLNPAGAQLRRLPASHARLGQERSPALAHLGARLPRAVLIDRLGHFPGVLGSLFGDGLARSSWSAGTVCTHTCSASSRETSSITRSSRRSSSATTISEDRLNGTSALYQPAHHALGLRRDEVPAAATVLFILCVFSLFVYYTVEVLAMGRGWADRRHLPHPAWRHSSRHAAGRDLHVTWSGDVQRVHKRLPRHRSARLGAWVETVASCGLIFEQDVLYLLAVRCLSQRRSSLGRNRIQLRHPVDVVAGLRRIDERAFPVSAGQPRGEHGGDPNDAASRSGWPAAEPVLEPVPEKIPAVVFDRVKNLRSDSCAESINLAISGGVTGILGLNGAGKSTLFNLPMGRCKPTTGQVRLFGIDPWQIPRPTDGLASCRNRRSCTIG